MSTHPLQPSPIQQARQERLFCLETGIFESPRVTAKVEAQPTTELTYWQTLQLRAAKEDRKVNHLKVIAKNFERRQLALMAE